MKPLKTQVGGRDFPSFRGAKASEGLRICEDDPIYLNPYFGERMMGFQIGWTELKDSVTPPSRRSLNTSVNASENQQEACMESE